MIIRETEGMVVTLVKNYIVDDEGATIFVGELPPGSYNIRVDIDDGKQIGYMNARKEEVTEVIRSCGKNRGAFVARAV